MTMRIIKDISQAFSGTFSAVYASAANTLWGAKVFF